MRTDHSAAGARPILQANLHRQPVRVMTARVPKLRRGLWRADRHAWAIEPACTPFGGRAKRETAKCRTFKEFRASVPDSKARGDVACREKRHPLRHLSIQLCRWFRHAAPRAPAFRRSCPAQHGTRSDPTVSALPRTRWRCQLALQYSECSASSTNSSPGSYRSTIVLPSGWRHLSRRSSAGQGRPATSQ